MAEIKILLLCNNTIAIPALLEMLFFKQLAAVVIPQKNTGLAADLEELMKGTGVPLLTVDRKNFKKIIRREMEEKKAAAVLMMTFPYIIPADLLEVPPKGFINFHYGKLPEYRGPEPIFSQVMQQEQNPGLTVHVVTTGVDDGPVILQESLSYDADDTYGQLQHKLAESGARLVRLLLKILSFGSVLPSVPQDESLAAYHKKPTMAILMINWQKMDSSAIKALVNACNPWNKGAGTIINNRQIGITEVEITGTCEPGHTAGEIIFCDRQNGLVVATSDNKKIRINIIYTNEGFFSGSRLSQFQVKAGDSFA